jgi:hypothetical protein
MTKKIKTIDLKGKDYAQVSERIKEFRQDCPNGLIETKPEQQTDGSIIFSARILKDKANPNSGEGTGHSMGKIKDDKNFEKLETIAIGRALAILGYMASGEVASSEEMEEFLSEKENKRLARITELKAEVDKITKVEDLREFYKNNKGLGVEFDNYVTAKANELKNS